MDNLASHGSRNSLCKGDMQLGSHHTAQQVPIILGRKMIKDANENRQDRPNHYTLLTGKRCQ